MIDDWFSTIELPLTWQQFWQLPQNPAYKYEYFDGRAWLSPRPKTYHAVLDLRTFARPIAGMATDDKLVIRPLQDADWQRLPELFAAAFHRVQPFASLTDDDRLEAAEDCLGHTRECGEGPLVGEACLVAARAADDALGRGEPDHPSARRSHRARARPAAPDVDLRQPVACTPGRWHGAAGYGRPGLAAAWICGVGQHVPVGQRVEHALALAGGLQTPGAALVAEDGPQGSQGAAERNAGVSENRR